MVDDVTQKQTVVTQKIIGERSQYAFLVDPVD
jgi:hypothetical protein